MKQIMSLAILAWLFTTPTVWAQETPHRIFVSEFIRELIVNEQARAMGEKETGDKNGNPFAAGIRSSTRINEALHAEIDVLKGMHLNHPFEELIGDITNFYEAKIDFHEELIDIFKSLVGGPQPGIDYAELAAMAPNIGELLERVDRSLLQMTPLVFSTLIDPTPDSAGRIEHLNITKAQRDQLLEQLNQGFAPSLPQKEPSTILQSAAVLRKLLMKDYKYADQAL